MELMVTAADKTTAMLEEELGHKWNARGKKKQQKLKLK